MRSSRKKKPYGRRYLSFSFVLLATFSTLLAVSQSSRAAGGGSEDSFTGVISARPSGVTGDWVIGGRVVHATSATKLKEELGAAAVGATAEVKGTIRADASYDATVIEVKTPASGGGGGGATGDSFTGIISSLPASGFIGAWNVGGRTVYVSSSTLIKQELGAVALGAAVEVKGTARTDGSIDASVIEVKAPASGGGGGGTGGGGGATGDSFTGAVSSLPASGFIGVWTVGGRTVHVSSSTLIKQELGTVALGATVEVKGTSRTDGSIDASVIEVKAPASGGGGGGTGGGGGATGDSFTGAVSSLPASGFIGVWTVGGRTVHVSSSTLIKQELGTVALGATVEVKGTSRTDGSIDASVIEVKAPASGGGGGGTGAGGVVSEILGVVQALPGGSLIGEWRVEGRGVRVSSSTILNQERGAFAVGVFVEAKGTIAPDGILDATSIELKLGAGTGSGTVVLFEGTVEILPTTPGFLGDWRVSGRTVRVSTTTRIGQTDGPVTLSAVVMVKGLEKSAGVVDASEIEVRWSRQTQAVLTTWIVPSTARVLGGGGAFFTTDLTIVNTGSTDANIKLKFLGHDRDGSQGPEQPFTILARQTQTFRDVLGSVFQLTEDYGSIRVTSDSSTLSILTQTSTPGAGGTFGQSVPGSSWSEMIRFGDIRTIPGVRQSATDDSGFRTNLILASGSEFGIEIELILVTADGQPAGSLRVTLPPLGMKQLSRVAQLLGVSGNVEDARIVLHTTTHGGVFTAYASAVDNKTGDPRTLSIR